MQNNVLGKLWKLCVSLGWVFIPVVCTRVFTFYFPYPLIFIHISWRAVLFICSRYFQQLLYLFTAFTFLSYYLLVCVLVGEWVGWWLDSIWAG